MIERGFKGGKRYWILLLSLFALFIVGFIFYLKQLKIGLGITGMARDISWGLYIANFTFLVGVAASAVMVILPFYLHSVRVFKKIRVLSEFLAVSSIVMCLLFVLVDLGQPKRLFNLFLYPSFSSILFFDVIVLLGYLLLTFLSGWFTLDYEQRGEAPPLWIKVLIYLSIPWAISIHTVTAFIYLGLSGRSFWHEALLAPRFLASAFCSGPSFFVILLFILERFSSFKVEEEAFDKLSYIIAYAMIIHVFFIFVEMFSIFYGKIPEHESHLKYLLFGLPALKGIAFLYWISIFLAVLSLIILLSPKFRKRYLLFAAFFVFFSVMIEKGIGLVVPGFIPSPLGQFIAYVPTFPEVMITIGIYALGFLVLSVLFKVAIS